MAGLIYTASTSITISVNSLADGAARESTALDNTSLLHLDAQLAVNITLASGSPASHKRIYIYAYGSEDGTDYTDNATGTDAAITLRVPTNLYILGAIEAPTSGGLLYKSHPFSVAKAFGFALPRKWGVVIENKTGLAFHTSGNTITYSGVKIG